MSRRIACFKAYDIRGKLLTELDENIAFRIGKAIVEVLSAKSIVVGSDVRLTSNPLKLALSAGAISAGADVIDIGMVGTEEVYFATSLLKVDAGIEITASHNPLDYNGMKIVKKGSVPISGDSGLKDIRQRAERYDEDDVNSALAALSDNGQIGSPNDFLAGEPTVSMSLFEQTAYRQQSTRSEYVAHVCSYIDIQALHNKRFVVNAGNGAAGPALDAIENYLRSQGVWVLFDKVHHQPDGQFPNGIPNPLLPEARSDTADAVIACQADMGIAWDGDFDRCFLFDETGQFIEGYYIVGLLAEAFLKKHPGQGIIYDPRVYWNTEEIIASSKGKAIKSKTGHAFIKERMRKEDAVYGGEMSAHHYFRDFAYCDSGMIPWLLVAELMAVSKQPLSILVNDRIARFPSSGEINSTVTDADQTLSRVLAHYRPLANEIDETDGLGLSFGNWRFNLRKSNTEPVIRLNVEGRGDEALVAEKTSELLNMIRR
ncbi:phosphomannomutase CpsG [Alteromonas oceanisediminis]|uniref:phosphomannomutase CpsG n=1 Tax=Alteromonas oceanisediminis TaxID=2836180 RepID=UPI001BDADCB2|nr:phosphomannomutase CpsG [Alteromonas oceanisediminis]MBT0586486.1 phosphomannomutase CpsG [Alteromonas oceanisediminis]